MSKKKAKILTAKEQKIAVDFINQGDNAERNLVLLLLSTKQGMRAAEIAATTWLSVTAPDGALATTIAIVGKGTRRRELPLHPDVRRALAALRLLDLDDTYIAHSVHPRFRVMSANAVTLWFKRFYSAIGFAGCSSHSGRRTTITAMAQTANIHGCSLRDVQAYAGHSRLDTTEGYIEFSANLPKLVASL